MRKRIVKGDDIVEGEDKKSKDGIGEGWLLRVSSRNSMK